MVYDFDRVIERRNTASLKWDSRRSIGIQKTPDEAPPPSSAALLPLWVADMDFQSPPEVIEALRQRSLHGVFGYTLKGDRFYQTVIDWFHSRQSWTIEKEWILTVPGVVPSLSLAILCCTSPGDSIVIQPPVYHPFRLSIGKLGRTVVENPLQNVDGRYAMDLDQLERCFQDGARMLILCSPHNPVGRVWKQKELANLAELCRAYQVLILSDEIHSDLILDGHQHLPTAAVCPEIAGSTITCTSASKTFNLAGLNQAQIIISNPGLRGKFQTQMDAVWIGGGNIFGVLATQTAYTCCAGWLDELLIYIEENFIHLRNRIEQDLPRIRVTPLEGTYLAWLDTRSLGLSEKDINARLYGQALWLDEGSKFGTGGIGFQRINLACPRSVLNKALDRLVAALSI